MTDNSLQMINPWPLNSWSNWNLEMLVLRREKTRRTQRKTQSTYDAGSGNRTWDTLVVGERSYHCATPAPPKTVRLQHAIWRKSVSCCHLTGGPDLVYNAGSGNRTWDTLMVGEHCHHFATPAPPKQSSYNMQHERSQSVVVTSQEAQTLYMIWVTLCCWRLLWDFSHLQDSVWKCFGNCSKCNVKKI